MKKILLATALLTSLNCFSQNKYKDYTNNDRDGLALTVGGIVFSASALLEGDANYTTVQIAQINPTTQTHKYNTLPFFQQYPRAILFTVGMTFTIAGLITLKNNK